MGQIHVDDMTLEIMCTTLPDFRANSVGAVSKNVFSKIGLNVALYGTDPC